MSAHTPGPWDASNSRPGYILGDSGDNRFTVANVRVRCGYPSEALRNHAEMEANTRLIAAAPELLAALRAIVNSSGSITLPLADQPDDTPHTVRATHIKAAAAAIAKAEGEPHPALDAGNLAPAVLLALSGLGVCS